MCLAVYLASDQPLPEIPWDKETPAFHVRSSGGAALRTHLSLPHVAYAGSSQGCGCGFAWQAELEAPLPPSLGDRDECSEHAALADYVEARMSAGAAIELYVAWAGEEGEPVHVRLELAPDDLRRRVLIEHSVAVVRRSTAG